MNIHAVEMSRVDHNNILLMLHMQAELVEEK